MLKKVLFLSYYFIGRNHTIFYDVSNLSLYSLNRNTMVGETWRVWTLKMSPLCNFWFYLLLYKFCVRKVFFFMFFRFGSKQIWLFRNGLKHWNKPKQTEKNCFWFLETNRKSTETDWVSVCFGSNRNFFCLFRGHPNCNHFCQLSSLSQSHIPKGFNLCIRDPGEVVWWKNSSKISC
jgi:hypothetical protein